MSAGRTGPAAAIGLYGATLLITVALGWGIAWPVNKLALTEIPPWTFRALGQIVGAIGLLAIARIQCGSLAVPRAAIVPIAVVAFLNISVFHVATAIGIMMMEAGRATIIIYTFPIWASVFGYFLLGERLTVGRWIALAMGIVALAMLIGPEAVAIGGAPLGALFMVVAAISFGLGSVLFKRFGTKLPVVLLAGWQLLIGAVPVAIGAALLEAPPDLAALSTPVVVATVYAVAIGMIYCHWAWFAALRITSPSVASIAVLASPVAGVFTAAILLGEDIGWRELLALTLVLASTCVVLVGGAGLAALRGRSPRQ